MRYQDDQPSIQEIYEALKWELDFRRRAPKKRDYHRFSTFPADGHMVVLPGEPGGQYRITITPVTPKDTAQ